MTATTATTSSTVLNTNERTWTMTPSSSHAATRNTSAASAVLPKDLDDDSFIDAFNGSAAGQDLLPLPGHTGSAAGQGLLPLPGHTAMSPAEGSRRWSLRRDHYMRPSRPSSRAILAVARSTLERPARRRPAPCPKLESW